VRGGVESSPRVLRGVPRDRAVGEAAVFGLVGTVRLSAGSLAASAPVATPGPWLAAVPAVLVSAAFAFYGCRQYAHGVSTVVADASGG